MKSRLLLFISVLVIALLVECSPRTACQLTCSHVDDASHKEDADQWCQALVQAVLRNDIARMRTLLIGGREHGLTLRSFNRFYTGFGDSLLTLALVKHSRLSVLRLLLQAGENSERLTFYGLEPSTPLMIAATYGTPEAVHFLLAHGAKVNARNPQGKTAFLYTAQYRTVGAVPILRLLLRYGADAKARETAGATALILAANAGQPATLRFLLAQGIPLEAQGKHVSDGRFEGTALMVAAYESNLAAVKELLRHHAKVNARDANGATPLMHAVEWVTTDPAVVSTLLRHGADANAKDQLGRTAWDLANGPFPEGNYPKGEVLYLLSHVPDKTK